MSDENLDRRDAQVRGAVERIHRDLHSISEARKVFERTLRELAQLSSSPLGIALEKRLDDGGKPELACAALWVENTQSAAAADERCRHANFALDTASASLYGVLESGSARVLDRDDIKALQSPCECWPTLESMLVIPLYFGHEAVALFCLANSAQTYDLALAKRAWPLLTTCISVLRILQSQQLHSSSEKRLLLGEETWRENFSLVETLSPVGMVTLNRHYEILRVNPAAEKLFGISNVQFLQKPIDALIPERFPNEHRTQTFVLKPTNNESNSEISVSGYHAKGYSFPLEMSILHYEEYKQPRIMLLLRDRSEVQEMRLELEAELQRFRAVSDLAPIGILQTDANWNTVYCNDRWLEISGLHDEQIQGHGWNAALYHEDVQTTLEELHSCISRGHEFRSECRFQRSEEEIIWVLMQARPLFDFQGEIEGFVATLVDNSYHHQTEEKLRNLAERDALTGLANRILFFDRLEHGLTRMARHGSLALLCLDLDGFKNINDSLGHDAGDQLLIEVSRRLHKCVRSEDTVARVGGDEFNILLEGLNNANAAAEISTKILKSLEKPCIIAHQEVFISTSIGICFAMAGQQTHSAKNLLKQADMALYRAKAEGRNNYQYYSPELEEASRRRLELGNSLHRALSRAEFEVYYQLQAEVATNKIVGVEALLRWRHQEKGMLSPTEFIPLLEETGLISPVSRWLWHHSFQQLRAWIDQGLLSEDACLSINISPRQFRDTMLLIGIEGAMADSGLQGKNIVVEITESALISDSPNTLNVLLKLKELGILIALDDFGTGYSSLSYLKKFPIDIIKIDRTFVMDIMVDKEDSAITQAVLALAHSLNLAVVAEGVESKEILDKLLRWGCDCYQGFFLNKPAAASEVAESLRTFRQQKGAQYFIQ